jgi:hypothetical protein
MTSGRCPALERHSNNTDISAGDVVIGGDIGR